MTRNSNYKSLNSLMRHIRDSSGIRIGGGSDKRALAQMGYFHGYKGYRYSGTATKRIPYSGFDELRDCVAHNGTVFDTRFATAGIRRQVPALLLREIGFPQSVRVEFDTITDYFVVIVYLAGCIGFPKREVHGVIKRYSALTDELRSRVPVRIFDMIVHTDNRAKIAQLERSVRSR